MNTTKHNSSKIFSKKGFLFTISVILFASTLVIFAQSYSQINSKSEEQIIVSTKPFGVLMMNDDISFDLERLFGLSLDFNSSNPQLLTISGVIDPSAGVIASLTDYESLLNETLFPRVVGNQSIDLSLMKSGNSIMTLGDNLIFDYNYGNNVEFISIDKSITSLDLDLRSTGGEVSYEWISKSSGEVPVGIKYSNDSNGFYLVETLDANSVSTLMIFSPDGNVLVDFGKIAYGGVDYNSSFRLSVLNENELTYSFDTNYPVSNPFPIKMNATISNSQEKIDSNSVLILQR